MVNNDIQEVVDKILADLQNKIKDISEFADSVNEKYQPKALELRNIAVNVLIKASDKLQEEASDVKDLKDFIDGLQLIANKSQVLYEEVIRRISLLNDSNEVKNVIGELKGNQDFDSKLPANDFFAMFDSASKSTSHYEKQETKMNDEDLSKKIMGKLNNWFN